MIKNIMPDAARDMLYALPAAPEAEAVALCEALGRVLAKDIIAEIPIPPFDRSPYDGYALRGADTAAAAPETPVTLKITEELPAGTMPSIEIKPGYAAKILTGAPIPPGADCTVKYEFTEQSGSEVKILAPILPGSDVVYAGEDVKQGVVIAKKGEILTPSLMGLIASVGVDSASVYSPPRAAIINTGSELIEPGNPLAPAKIYNSNFFTLSGYLRQQGLHVCNAGVVDDDPGAIAERIKTALSGADAVITTGGAAAGDYDCAISSFEKLGADILFWRAQMKPGGAAAAAVLDGKLVLALSGNPGASIVFLMRCAMPYIKKLCGKTDCYPKYFDVCLKSPLKKPSDRLRLLRGRLEISDCKAYFAQYNAQGGGSISSFNAADIIAEIPAGSPPLPAGAIVKAWYL